MDSIPVCKIRFCTPDFIKISLNQTKKIVCLFRVVAVCLKVLLELPKLGFQLLFRSQAEFPNNL
jgi:hypothetical protein